MIDPDRARAWFEGLRDRLAAAFEAIEDEVGSGGDGTATADPGRFERTAWQRPGGGGGVMALLRGRVLEKAGVNVSTVEGTFSEEMRARIPGAAEDPRFWASGISLVVHPRSPMVPAAHMNTRMIVTSKAWFGGGADLTPAVPFDEDTADFHAAMAGACEASPSGDHPRFKTWCDDYFWLRHRGEARGVGGIFFDDLATADNEADFAFVRAVGESFLDIYPRLIRRRFHLAWGEAERRAQLTKRARYVEFNLLYDRGTRFGLETGGNTEAILMSLPPMAAWP